MTKTELAGDSLPSVKYSKPRLTQVGAVEKLTAGPSTHRAEENAYKGK